jgi:hypothetical protein
MYASPNITRVIKLRRMRGVGHVARIKGMHTKFLLENLKGRDHSKDLGVDGKILLEWNLEKECGNLWTEFIWLSTGNSGKFLRTR